MIKFISRSQGEASTFRKIMFKSGVDFADQEMGSSCIVNCPDDDLLDKVDTWFVWLTLRDPQNRAVFF